MMELLIRAFIVLEGFITLNGFDEMKSPEKELIRQLINKYEYHGIFGRPVNNSLETIVIEHKLQLIQILDLDENRQILVTNCWSNLRWKDALLAWDPNDHANITTVRVFPDHIWTPDIMLYNFADERSEDRRECRVKIFSDGSALWVPQSLYKSSCSVEITYFPFDTQNCKLEFGSLAYDNTKLDIVWWMTDNISENFIDYADYMPSNEWQIHGTDIDKSAYEEKILSKKIYRFAEHSENDGKLLYPILRYILRLSRNPSFYITILIVPCTLLSLLTLVIFWLPPESPAKLMLGISIFVAFFVLLLLLADFTPREVKNFPLIGAYFCLNMVMITSSAFLATLIINIHFKGAKTGPIPKIVRRIFIEGLGRLVFITQNVNLQATTITNQQPAKGQKFRSDSKSNSQIWTKNTDKAFRRRVMNNCDTYKLHGARQQPRVVIDEPYLNAFIQGHLEFERDIREISRYIRIIVNREKLEISKNLIAMEYRTLAVVLDRLFFVLYISTMVTAVIVCYSNTIIQDFDLSKNISNH